MMSNRKKKEHPCREDWRGCFLGILRKILRKIKKFVVFVIEMRYNVVRD